MAPNLLRKERAGNWEAGGVQLCINREPVSHLDYHLYHQFNSILCCVPNQYSITCDFNSPFKSIRARFSSNVVPDQTLQTEMWKGGNEVFLDADYGDAEVVYYKSWRSTFAGSGEQALAPTLHISLLSLTPYFGCRN
jgi:hypothetical protein